MAGDSISRIRIIRDVYWTSGCYMRAIMLNIQKCMPVLALTEVSSAIPNARISLGVHTAIMENTKLKHPYEH